MGDALYILNISPKGVLKHISYMVNKLLQMSRYTLKVIWAKYNFSWTAGSSQLCCEVSQPYPCAYFEYLPSFAPHLHTITALKCYGTITPAIGQHFACTSGNRVILASSHLRWLFFFNQCWLQQVYAISCSSTFILLPRRIIHVLHGDLSQWL